MQEMSAVNDELPETRGNCPQISDIQTATSKGRSKVSNARGRIVRIRWNFEALRSVSFLFFYF